MNDVNLFYKDLKGYPRGDLLILARKYNISDKLNNKSLAREIAKVDSEGIMQVGRMLFKTDCVDDVKPFYEKLGFTHNAYALRFDHI